MRPGSTAPPINTMPQRLAERDEKISGSSHESVQVQLVFVAVNGIRISHLRAYESAPHLRSDPKPV